MVSIRKRTEAEALCRPLREGNPAVKLTIEVLGDPQYSSHLKVVNLPGRHDGFEFLPGKLLVNAEERRGTESYRLNQGLDDDACASLGPDLRHVYGRVSGEADAFFHYAAYAKVSFTVE